MPFVESTGSLLAGRYRLEQRIGGTRRRVWSARDELFGRRVMVKVLPQEMADDPLLRDGFLSAARALARITHPNLVLVNDVGDDHAPGKGLLPYVVMEFLDGESLAERIEKGRLPWQEAARICAEVASALAVAHFAGLVHGDLRARDIILVPHGAKLGGFLSVEANADTAGLTAAVDVCALGAVLAEALTGGRGLKAALPADVPNELARLCVRALAADPALRPTAKEVATRLAHMADELAPIPATSSAGPDVAAELPAAPRTSRARHTISRTPNAGRRSWQIACAGFVVVILAVYVLSTVAHPGAGSGQRPRENLAIPLPVPPDEHPTPPLPTPTTSSTPAPPSSPVTSRATEDARMVQGRTDPAEVLYELQCAIDTGLVKDQIRQDVGVDLTNLVTALRREVAVGQTSGLSAQALHLEDKIATRYRERGITRSRAITLDSLLSLLQSGQG